MREDRDRPIAADDLAISFAVRNDLGPERDDAVIDEFLDRVGQSIDARVDARLASQRVQPSKQSSSGSSALAFASLGVGIPVTAIALVTTHGGTTGVIAMLVGWGGIAAVNFAHRR
jgi:hypothetical protein